jgi:hypothetical protein
MQARSMCGVGPYEQFWTWGVIETVKEKKRKKQKSDI